MRLERIDYKALNGRQKENYNFQKVSAVLADYGFATLRLTDDWNYADFLAVHTTGDVLRVQLKSRLFFAQRYINKDLYVAFGEGGNWYLYPHDEVLAEVERDRGTPVAWNADGEYHTSPLSRRQRELLRPWCVTGDASPTNESEPLSA
jgi:hypothetical protein